MGRSSVLEERATGNLLLSKEVVFSSEEDCYTHYKEILAKKEKQEKSEDVLKVTGTSGSRQRCSIKKSTASSPTPARS